MKMDSNYYEHKAIALIEQTPIPHQFENADLAAKFAGVYATLALAAATIEAKNAELDFWRLETDPKK